MVKMVNDLFFQVFYRGLDKADLTVTFSRDSFQRPVARLLRKSA